MLTPAELERIPVEVQKLMIGLSSRIMEDVVDRINMINSISRTADYELYLLSKVGLSSDTIRKAIKNTLQKTDAEIDRIYGEVIKDGYARAEELYEATGKPFTRYEDNQPIQQLVEAVKRQTKDELSNITQTTAFRVESGGVASYHTTAEYLKQKLDEAAMDITSGSFDYNRTIKNTIHEMTKSGVRVVEYESGWHNRIEVAARRAIMTGVTQVTAKINDMNAESLDTDYFEVSWHATARPAHQVWQGRVYSRKELETVCGLGTGPGLSGWNCYHSYYPFLPGISKRTYTDEQLDDMNAKENEKKAYRGKEYTTYEATQRQRQLETIMRKQRQDIKLLEMAGAAEDDIISAKALYHGTMDEYVKFSKGMGLPQQRERIYSDGLGLVK
ncbi:MAG TPA: minor capsid protein [Clostridiales bacterium]|nr:minor capsid protein [Clostridiales bacterium]